MTDQRKWPNRISVPEIAGRMNICIQSVYAMLEAGQLPAIRQARRWIISRHAYDEWERTCNQPFSRASQRVGAQ